MMRDRDLIRLYWPVELRPAFDALFSLDDALADVVARANEPVLGAIKLAWWRESLEKLDHEPPPQEPRLRAVAADLLPRAISGKELAGMEPGWATLLDERPDNKLIEQRGAILFQIGARLLGVSDAGLSDAGALYAQIDVARRGIDDGRSTANALGAIRFTRRARPLSALAALASRDLRRRDVDWEPQATPGRAWALLRHRLTGRL